MKKPDPSSVDPTIDEHPGRVPKNIRRLGREAAARLSELKIQGRQNELEPDLGLGPVGSRRDLQETIAEPEEAFIKEPNQNQSPGSDSSPRGPGLGGLNSGRLRAHLSENRRSVF